MRREELKDIRPEDYTVVNGNKPGWYRIFQPTPGSAEWYLRFILDEDNEDVILTFGPLDAEEGDRMAHLFARTYCHVSYDPKGTESLIAQGIPLEEEKGNHHAN